MHSTCLTKPRFFYFPLSAVFKINLMDDKPRSRSLKKISRLLNEAMGIKKNFNKTGRAVPFPSD